jgi:hypothetical protein
MAREMGAMWRTASPLVGVPAAIAHPASDAAWNPAGDTASEAAQSRSGGRSWIPTLERTPPVVQFFVRLARWITTKCQSQAAPAPQLRLVGHLALGAKRHLSLVEVGGVQFLVGGGTEHVTVIAPIPSGSLGPTEDLQDAGRSRSL